MNNTNDTLRAVVLPRLVRPDADGWWWCIDRYGRATMRQVRDGVVVGCDCCQDHCNAALINARCYIVTGITPWEQYEGSTWQKATQQEPNDEMRDRPDSATPQAHSATKPE